MIKTLGKVSLYAICIFILIFLFSLFISSVDKMHATKAAKERIDGRFEVIKTFYAFDGPPNKSGKVIKDRVSGKCYLYIVVGGGNWGGPAMSETDKSECEKEL